MATRSSNGGGGKIKVGTRASQRKSSTPDFSNVPF